MSRSAEVAYRRQKVLLGEYQDLMTDELGYLRQQVDRLIDLFSRDFENANEILDVGAGTCWFAAYMKKKYDKTVLSLDVSREAMELSPKLYGFEGDKFVGEVKELAALDKRFDLICCSAVIHHLDDLDGFFVQIATVLRPGGLFVAFNEPKSPQFLPLKYVHRFWFGRSSKAHGVQELPRTLSEYMSPIPEDLEACILVDYEKSRWNYEQTLGKWAASLYSFFAQTSILYLIESYVFPEAIVIAMRRKQPDGRRPSEGHSLDSFRPNQRKVGSSLFKPTPASMRAPWIGQSHFKLVTCKSPGQWVLSSQPASTQL